MTSTIVFMSHEWCIHGRRDNSMYMDSFMGLFCTYYKASIRSRRLFTNFTLYFHIDYNNQNITLPRMMFAIKNKWITFDHNITPSSTESNYYQLEFTSKATSICNNSTTDKDEILSYNGNKYTVQSNPLSNLD